MSKRVIKAAAKNSSQKVEISVSIETTLGKREASKRYEWMRNRIYNLMSLDFDNSQIKIK